MTRHLHAKSVVRFCRTRRRIAPRDLRVILVAGILLAYLELLHRIPNKPKQISHTVNRFVDSVEWGDNRAVLVHRREHGRQEPMERTGRLPPSRYRT